MYFAFSNIKAKNWGLNREFIKYGIVMSVPLIFHSLALNILAQSDRLVIAKFCSASDVGVYSLAYQYAILVNIFLNAINEAWLPWFQDQYVVGNFIGIKDNVKSIITFGCFLSIGCAAVAPEAILILGGKAYESGIWAVPPILMGLLCQFLYTRYVHIELQEKKTSIISTGTMIAALLNLVLNFMFIPKYGFVAAGYTTLFSYIVLFVIHFLVTKLLLKINLYDDLSMIVSMLVGFALICGMAILYNHIIIRYVCILIITVVYLLTNKDVVMKVLGKKIISKFK